MSQTTELLNFVYQNAQMGTDTIRQLLDIVDEDDFKRHLEAQEKGYQDMEQEALRLLEEQGCGEKGLSAFEKLRTYLMIDLQTLTDRSASHVAEMMMIGSNMGVINAVKNLKKYPEGDKQVRALMERLLRFEEDNIQQLKKFL